VPKHKNGTGGIAVITHAANHPGGHHGRPERVLAGRPRLAPEDILRRLSAQKTMNRRSGYDE